MPQIFDIQNYVEILQDFILNIQDVRFTGSPESDDLFHGICEVLGVSKISMFKTPHGINHHDLHGDLEAVYYDNKNVDTARTYKFVKENRKVVTVEYTFYQNKNDSDWTEDDKKRLRTLGDIIFVNNSFTLLSDYVEFTDTHDLRFVNSNNLSCIYAFLEMLIAEKRIDKYGVIFFNIHNFSDINKNFGQDKGTEILEDYLNHVKALVQENKSLDERGEVAAAGGDYGVVVFHKNDYDRVFGFLKKADMKAIRQDGTEETFTMTSHMGVNVDLGQFTTSYKIMDTLSLAVNLAHKSDGNPIVYYDENLHQKVEEQREIERRFSDALENEEFQVYYQPKVDLHDNKLKGAEALVRWIHDGKMIYPDSFIPVLESNLSIKYLDIYMLEHVCSHIAGWISEGKKPVQISVNLSRASLTMPNIIDVIKDTIKKFNIPKNLIQIELTESASGTTMEMLRKTVEVFNAEGISTAMDDFGTGYSSLSLVKELPWDVLKIDKSLLEGAQKMDSNDQRMFKSIISMANNMGLECIVEGVETGDDINLLKESNCWMAQGFFFSKPIPKSEFDKLL
ncbi:MAG: EAL domain-containing protein [Treponema sp.]|nr:EAL domain-containing protein [Treponema sp.]